jgi:sulfur carrier protein ThiS
MEIKVFNEKENLHQIVQFTGKNVKELLKQIDINSETVLIVKNDEVVTVDEPLQNNDVVKLLSVISGG